MEKQDLVVLVEVVVGWEKRRWTQNGAIDFMLNSRIQQEKDKRIQR